VTELGLVFDPPPPFQNSLQVIFEVLVVDRSVVDPVGVETVPEAD
jgi:hypothetical protein